MNIVLKSDEYKTSKEFLGVDFDKEAGIFRITLYRLIKDSREFNIENYEVVSFKEFSIQSIFAPKTLFAILINESGQLSTMVNMTEFVNSRDVYIPMTMFNGMNKGYAMAFFFNETEEDFLAISYLPTMMNTEYTHDNYPESIFHTILRYYPQVENLFKVRVARRDMAGKLDPNDSVASLETQVDMLYRIVEILVDNLPEAKALIAERFPVYNDLKTVMGNTSILTVKSQEKCVQDILEKKAQVRNLQKDYYELKNSLM